MKGGGGTEYVRRHVSSRLNRCVTGDTPRWVSSSVDAVEWSFSKWYIPLHGVILVVEGTHQTGQPISRKHQSSMDHIVHRPG